MVVESQDAQAAAVVEWRSSTWLLQRRDCSDNSSNTGTDAAVTRSQLPVPHPTAG